MFTKIRMLHASVLLSRLKKRGGSDFDIENRLAGIAASFETSSPKLAFSIYIKLADYNRKGNPRYAERNLLRAIQVFGRNPSEPYKLANAEASRLFDFLYKKRDFVGAFGFINMLRQIDPSNEAIIFFELLCVTHDVDAYQLYDESGILDLLRRRVLRKSEERRVGVAATNLLKSCLQSEGIDGAPLPISRAHRADFFRDPKAMLAVWRDSFFFQMTYPQVQPTRSNSSVERLLFVSKNNWNFLQGIVQTLNDSDDLEVRTLEVGYLPSYVKPSAQQIFGHRVNLNNSKCARADLDPDSYAAQLIDWADCIFVEWCADAAIWLSHYCPPDKKLIVRLHSYEAFTHMPHLVSWGKVDTLITVSEHMKNLVLDLIPLQDFGVNIVSVPNYNDFSRYDLPKKEVANKTIALIGYNNQNKGPLKALELLAELLRTDSEWRLFLVGDGFPDEPASDQDVETKKLFYSYIEDHDLSDCVVEYGFTYNLEVALQDIGYILSLSDRESAHISVMQAMASGCIPVIYPWGLVERWGGAASVYSERWLVKDKAEAASRIRKIVRSNALIEENRALAKKDVLEKYDAPSVMPRIKEVICGSCLG